MSCGEVTVSVKGGEFLGQLSDCYLLEKVTCNGVCYFLSVGTANVEFVRQLRSSLLDFCYVSALNRAGSLKCIIAGFCSGSTRFESRMQYLFLTVTGGEFGIVVFIQTFSHFTVHNHCHLIILRRTSAVDIIVKFPAAELMR